MLDVVGYMVGMTVGTVKKKKQKFNYDHYNYEENREKRPSLGSCQVMSALCELEPMISSSPLLLEKLEEVEVEL